MKIRSTLRKNFPTLRKNFPTLRKNLTTLRCFLTTLRRNFPTLRNFQFRLMFCKHRCSRVFWHFNAENIVKSRVFRRILCQR